MLRPVSAILVAVIMAGAGVQHGPAPQMPPPNQVFRARVDTVAVYPLVSAPDGRLSTDLTRADFVVLDNGKPAAIEVFSSDEQPITAALMLDMSASMDDRLVRVREAASRLVDAIGPLDRLRIGSFGSEISVSPWLTGDKQLLARILREELWPGGSTPLWNAIGAGMKSLAAESGRRTIVVVTDGVYTTGGTQLGVATRAANELFMIYGLGMEGQGLSPALVNLIAQTGGGYFSLSRKDDLGAAFARLALELRHQYLVGFVPNDLDGKVHTLSVQVTRPGFSVRAPQQFLAPREK
jgi:Ca-activated chloride channel family protein